jgi:hypothetical protein
LLEVATEQVDQPRDEGPRRSVLRIVKGAPELGHHALADREGVVRG